jgi:type IV pilus assembly protein PilW
MKQRPSSRFLWPNLRRSPASQDGLTLIELLVSMVIAMIVSLAAASVYLNAAEASRFSDEQQRMHEDAQAALNALTQHLNLAGTNPIQPNRASNFRRNPLTDTMAVRGCDGVATNITTTGTISSLACATPSSATEADSIAVRYEADTYNTDSINARPTDCLGASLTTATASVSAVSGGAISTVTASFFEAENRFFISQQNSVPSLSCHGNGGGSSQPIVENIEDMQITYGVSSPTNTGSLVVAGYLNADGIATNANLSALSTAQRWAKVLTVRICVLARSSSPLPVGAASAQYIDCHGNTVSTNASDQRLRRAYTTTLVLRNRLEY